MSSQTTPPLEPPWRQELTKGTVVAGRFTVDGVLGSGGFATVYNAVQSGLERHVALKVLKPDTKGFAPAFYERFEQEARIAAGLKHPNVVSIYDYGVIEETKQPYIVMEMLEGRTIGDEIREHGPLQLERVLKLFIPCLDALGEGHKRGIIHKDLKPANLFLVHPGHPIKEALIVTDYGVARIQDGDAPALTGTGQFLGTPQYLAPEYLKGEPIDTSFDVYQMGLILVEALSGQPAVDFDEVYPCLAAHLQGNLAIPAELQQGVLGEIILRAVHLDCSERYRDAHEMRDALQKLAAPQHSSVIATPTPPSYVAERSTHVEQPLSSEVNPPDSLPDQSRSRSFMVVGGVLAVMVGLVLCVVFSAVGFVVWSWDRDKTTHDTDTNDTVTSVLIKEATFASGERFEQTDNARLEMTLKPAIPVGELFQIKRENRSVSQRSYKILKVRKGQMRKVRVAYEDKHTYTKISNTPAEREKSLLEGNTYLVEKKGDTLTAKSAKGKTLARDEETEVLQEHAHFGEPDALSSMMPKRKIKIGERVEMSEQAAEDIFGSPGSPVEVDSFYLTLDRVQYIDNVRVAVFLADLKLRPQDATGQMTMTMDLEGEVFFEIKSGRPLKLELAGPLKASGNAEGMDLQGDGRATISISVRYLK